MPIFGHPTLDTELPRDRRTLNLSLTRWPVNHPAGGVIHPERDHGEQCPGRSRISGDEDTDVASASIPSTDHQGAIPLVGLKCVRTCSGKGFVKGFPRPLGVTRCTSSPHAV